MTDQSPPGFRLTDRDGTVLAETFARIVHGGVDHLSTAFEAVGDTLRHLHTSLVEQGADPHQAPSDPMARALHLRQHRNTGPQVHADPRRNRR